MCGGLLRITLIAEAARWRERGRQQEGEVQFAGSPPLPVAYVSYTCSPQIRDASTASLIAFMHWSEQDDWRSENALGVMVTVFYNNLKDVKPLIFYLWYLTSQTNNKTKAQTEQSCVQLNMCLWVSSLTFSITNHGAFFSTKTYASFVLFGRLQETKMTQWVSEITRRLKCHEKTSRGPSSIVCWLLFWDLETKGNEGTTANKNVCSRKI